MPRPRSPAAGATPRHCTRDCRGGRSGGTNPGTKVRQPVAFRPWERRFLQLPGSLPGPRTFGWRRHGEGRSYRRRNRPGSLPRTKNRRPAPHLDAAGGPRDGGDVESSCREGAGRIHGVRAAHRWTRNAPRVPDREGLGEVSWLEGFVRTDREGSGWLSKPQGRTPLRRSRRLATLRIPQHAESKECPRGPGDRI